MSWWTDIRDTGVEVATLGMYSPRDARHKEAEARYAINSQIKAYNEQTALARQQLNEARAQTNAEKRRVNEKQIRSLRRNYRAQGAGLLGVGNPATEDMGSKLGG